MRIWLGMLMVVALPAAAEPAETCATVDVCLQRLHELAVDHDPDGGSAPETFALGRRMATMPDSVAPLVGLLADPDPRVADVASIALRAAPVIDAKHLPAIRAGLDRELGWLTPTLAAISGEAPPREAVARLLASGEIENQEGYTIQRLGARAIPALLEAARCAGGCESEDARLLAGAFGRLKADGRAAAPDLLALAAEPTTPGDTAAGALRMLGAIGRHAAVVEPALLALRDAKPELQREIDNALVGIGGESAGAILAERLMVRPHVPGLRTLAELGPAGVAAGPMLLDLLENDDEFDLRVAAARALGAIGYLPAVPRLVALLDDPSDVRLNWAAAEALGRLGSPDAESALALAATSHWYPPVRAQAETSLRAVRDGVPMPKDDDNRWAGFDTIPGEVESCEVEQLAGMQPADKLYASEQAHAKELATLAYDSVILSYGAADAAEQRANTAPGKTPIVEVTPENIVEHRESIRLEPTVALPVPGGWLAGGNRGEWGGELMFLPTAGTPVKVYDGNVEDIYRFGDGWIATVGVAHLSLNDGAVLAIRREGGKFTATPWRMLPGAPQHSWPVGGDLLIDTYGGGTVLLATDGSMRMLPCASAPARAKDDADAEADAVDAAVEAAINAAAAADAGFDEEVADPDGD